MARPNRYTAQEVIDALEGSGGILGTVAEKLHCNVKTVQNYIANYPTVEETWRGERLKLRSMAERTIAKAARDGDLKAAMFIVNQLDPETGEFTKPTMRNEVSGPNGGAIQHQVFDHGAAVAAIAGRSGGYRGESGADEDNRDGA